MDAFLEKMIDVLDTEAKISLDTKLKELEEWDSLSVVSFLAMANTSYGKKINPQAVMTAQTIGDLYTLIMQ